MVYLLLLVAGYVIAQSAVENKPDINLALKNLAVAQRDYNALVTQCQLQIQTMPQFDRLKEATQQASAACQAIKKVLDDKTDDCIAAPEKK